MIYFVKRPDDGRIKIGTTIRLSQRLRQLAAEHGDGLVVLAVSDGDRDIEQALHQRFAGLRVVGEWFEPGDDLLGFIVSEAREWDGSDEVPDTKAMVTFKCRSEWKEWLVRLAKRRRVTPSQLIDIALARFAELEGEEAPPER